MLTFLTLAGATLLSEDLTCIAAGILVQRGDIDPLSAVAACTLGIFAGDVGLWGVGRLFGAAAFQWSWLSRTVGGNRLNELREWLNRRAGRAIVASRFLPGTRLPLYVVAGLVRLPLSVFTRWALLATCLWTPPLVMLTAMLGDAFVARLTPILGASTANLAVVVLVLGCMHCSRARQARSSPAATAV